MRDYTLCDIDTIDDIIHLMDPELRPSIVIKSIWKYLSDRDTKLMRFYNANYNNSPIDESDIDRTTTGNIDDNALNDEEIDRNPDND